MITNSSFNIREHKLLLLHENQKKLEYRIGGGIEKLQTPSPQYVCYLQDHNQLQSKSEYLAAIILNRFALYVCPSYNKALL